MSSLYTRNTSWCSVHYVILNKPLVRLTTAHYQSPVSMISLHGSWLHNDPLQFLVGITFHFNTKHIFEHLNSEIKTLEQWCLYIQNTCSNSSIRNWPIQACDLQYIWITTLNSQVTIKPFEHATNSILKSYIYLYHKFEHLHDQSHSNMPPIHFPNQFNFQTIYPKFKHFNNHMLSPDTCSMDQSEHVLEMKIYLVIHNPEHISKHLGGNYTI